MKYTIILPENTKFFNITYEDGTTELITVGEKRVKVTPYKIIKECPECGGEMEPIGTASLTSPIAYKHRCRECGYEDSYGYVYPRIEYVEEE